VGVATGGPYLSGSADAPPPAFPRRWPIHEGGLIDA
jgi:hypothetical protein